VGLSVVLRSHIQASTPCAGNILAAKKPHLFQPVKVPDFTPYKYSQPSKTVAIEGCAYDITSEIRENGGPGNKPKILPSGCSKSEIGGLEPSDHHQSSIASLISSFEHQ
jgi:hypothetical protein